MYGIVSRYLGWRSQNWVNDIKERAEKLVVSAGKHDKDLGPLISPQAKARVEKLIQSGVDEGAELLLDGVVLQSKAMKMVTLLVQRLSIT